MIRVDRITPLKTSLVCSFTYDTRLEPFLNSNVLYVNYDFPVEGMPASVLSIPLLGVLSPLSWVTGDTIVAKEVDDRYASSLPRVASVMQGMYPDISIKASVECTRVPTPWEADPDRTCLLYSGGVDSTTSLLRNFSSKLTLASIRGTPELRLWEGEYWERVEQSIAPFVRSLGLSRHIIETNAVDLFNLDELSRSFRSSSLKWKWWENLAHGLILLSLCAPLTYHLGIGKMMIASSNSKFHNEPWGSTPDSDREIGWGGLTTIHDSFDLNRLMKIRDVLVPYITKHEGVVQLRVCTGKSEVRLASQALNCGQCEKCVRTMMILLTTGVDPVGCGFPSPDFVKLKEGLISGRLRHPDARTLRALQAAKTPPTPEMVLRYPGLDGFLTWFYRWEIPHPVKKKKITRRLAPDGTRRRAVVDAFLKPPKSG